MSLTISTETLLAAPDHSPNSRRMIGVGEMITLRATRAADWTIPNPGRAPQRHLRDVSLSFQQPGLKRIVATAGRDRAEVQVRVVAPSLRVRKVREESPPGGAVGAIMRLEYTLTPLGASFANLEFRERTCLADQLWGYFQTHRQAYANVLRHDPRPAWAGPLPAWSRVDARNRVTQLDVAGFIMRTQDMNWPITAGGFRWLVPDEYRIGQRVFRFTRPMPQAIRIDPAPGASRAPFRGTVTVWKGGCRVRKNYA